MEEDLILFKCFSKVMGMFKTLSGRLPEDSMRKILLLYILCLLGVEVTEVHFGV